MAEVFGPGLSRARTKLAARYGGKPCDGNATEDPDSDPLSGRLKMVEGSDAQPDCVGVWWKSARFRRLGRVRTSWLQHGVEDNLMCPSSLSAPREEESLSATRTASPSHRPPPQ